MLSSVSLPHGFTLISLSLPYPNLFNVKKKIKTQSPTTTNTTQPLLAPPQLAPPTSTTTTHFNGWKSKHKIDPKSTQAIGNQSQTQLKINPNQNQSKHIEKSIPNPTQNQPKPTRKLISNPTQNQSKKKFKTKPNKSSLQKQNKNPLEKPNGIARVAANIPQSCCHCRWIHRCYLSCRFHRNSSPPCVSMCGFGIWERWRVEEGDVEMWKRERERERERGGGKTVKMREIF